MAEIEDWQGVGWGFNTKDVNHAHPEADGTWWPGGNVHVPYGKLRYLLARSGRHHARQAVALVASNNVDDLLQAASSAGTAVELLTKAALATVDPRLLVHQKDPHQSLLVLGGHAARSKRDPLSVQSIGASEAVQLAAHLFPALPAVARAAPALAARNAALHMGLVEGNTLRAAVKPMCQFVDALLAPLGLDREPFWGDTLHVVDILLNEALSDRERVTGTKLAAAKQRYEDLISHLPDEAAAFVLAALSTRRPYVNFSSSQHDEPADCPACGEKGWLACDVERGPLQSQTTQHDVYQWVERTALPFAFECPVCQLDLDQGELSDFTFPTIELEDDMEPPEALYWEPDSEDLRIRGLEEDEPTE